MKKRKGDDWFPFWIDKWIFGSTRDELTVEQCAVWVDFLALSYKDEGYIRANVGMPYPIKRLSGLLNRSEELIQQTIERCLSKEVKKLRRDPDGTLYVISHPSYELSGRHKRRLGLPLDNPPNSKDETIEDKKREEGVQKKDTMSQITDIKERAILSCLKEVKNYPYEYEKTLKYIRELSIEFFNIDILEEVRKKCTWWLDHPLTKKSNPHSQLRNWFRLAVKFQKEADKEKRIGESKHKPTGKELDYSIARKAKLKELQKKYQSEFEKAKKAKNTIWLDEINNKIKEKISEFSQEYHKI